jgi:hypothetical protein
VLQLTHRETQVLASAGQLALAREQFQACGYLNLRALLEPRLLTTLLDAIDRSEFRHRVHGGIGTELCAEQGPASGTLELLMNDPRLFETISAITGCQAIGCFEGRVYRLNPVSGHYDSWHSDVGQDRLVALSLNLGREPFEGGLLQIRRADSPEIIAEIANRATGDAVIFRIDPSLRHRVGPVEGHVPRTAYAGWFRSRPDFRVLLGERLRGQRE